MPGTSMTLQQILDALPPDLGTLTLSNSEARVCEFSVDAGFTVTVEQEPGARAVYLYSHLITAEPTHSSALFSMLLEAQLFGREVGEGMSFGLDRSTGEILLWRKILEDNLTASLFEEALTEHINWTEHWLAKLSNDSHDGHPGTTDLVGDSMTVIRA